MSCSDIPHAIVFIEILGALRIHMEIECLDNAEGVDVGGSLLGRFAASDRMLLAPVIVVTHGTEY